MSDPEFDAQLWFTLDGCCADRHYLLHNPHTFPGRMAAWCPLKKVRFNISKSEVRECSDAARYWIKGFLAGNEPDAPVDEDGGYLPGDDPRMEEWRVAIAQFPATGLWIVSDRPCEWCGHPLLPTQPGLLCSQCLSESP